VKSGIFFASKRNEIFTSISNFASEAKVRAHPSSDNIRTKSNRSGFVTIISFNIETRIADPHSFHPDPDPAF
jgi:hypothetical protein